MAKKRITIGKSNGTSSTVDFNIPESPGTYRISATLENGTKLTAGNIVVNGTANTYKITVGLSNGSSVNAGTFTTPRISYKLTISSKPNGVATHTVYRNGVALSNGATIYYGETLTQSATATGDYNPPSVNWTSITVTGNVTATATAGSWIVKWRPVFSGSTTITTTSESGASKTISGLRAGIPTKATFSGTIEPNMGIWTNTISQRTLAESNNGVYSGSGHQYGNNGIDDWDYIEADYDYGFTLTMGANIVTFKPYVNGSFYDYCADSYTADLKTASVTITEIQQYY
jgi:hypothetical protein